MLQGETHFTGHFWGITSNLKRTILREEFSLDD